jgi:spermidine synthase
VSDGAGKAPDAAGGPDKAGKPALGAGDIAPGLMTEPLTDDWAFVVRSKREFERFRSPYQAVDVHDTETFGKLFRLDGHFMTSERDEFFYHENLVHPAALAHPKPEKALIVGGGDGGSAEELLKYPTMRSVTLVEIDLAVVDIARKYLQHVHRGSLDDPRLSLRIEDGFAFVRNTTEQYDLIVLDLTDPGGPSTQLYTPDFYAACAARLTPMGAMTLHVASPVAHPARIREALAALRAAFPVVTPYLVNVPLYGGMWMMACCAAQLDPHYRTPLEVDRRIAQRGIRDLQYFNGDMHRASLALPNFVKSLV